MTKTQAAREALHKAQRELEKAVAADYPKGKKTAHIHGRNWIPCEVVDVSGERVKVRAGRSGKEYWVGSWNLQGGSVHT